MLADILAQLQRKQAAEGESGVAAAFKLNWESLEPETQKLICLLSLFAQTPIPWSLIESAASASNLEFDIKAHCNILIQQYLLQEVAEDTYQIHARIRELLHLRVEELTAADELKRGFCQTMVAAAQSIFQTSTQIEIAKASLVIPHLAEAATVDRDWLSNEDLIWPFVGLGRFYQGQGAYEQALLWYEQCLSTAKERLGEEHPDVAQSLNKLAELYRSTERYAEAELLDQQALSMTRRRSGEEHPKILLLSANPKGIGQLRLGEEMREIMPTPPTPHQRKQIRDALVSAFPARSLLEQLLYFELDKNLNQISKDSNLDLTIFELIKTAESEAWLNDLIDAARKQNPENSQLEVIANKLLSPSATSASIVAPITIRQQQQRILILAANPVGTNQLRLDEELREIEQGLRAARQREQFEIKSALAAQLRDIHRSILDFKPHIVHFSGHGAGQEGLVFENETGQAKLVDGAALARLFKLFADQINCVVLNACYSEVQARAIAQHINYVVGMSQAVGDRAAIEFAVGFYDALWAGESIEFAHELGCTLIKIQGISEQLTPKLLKKQLDSHKLLNSKIPVVPPKKLHSYPLNIQLVSDTQMHSTLIENPVNGDKESEVDVDYTALKEFIQQNKFKEADFETTRIILWIANRLGSQVLTGEDLKDFPLLDLNTIDKLWLTGSNNKFGFSIQKQIWIENGYDLEKYNYQDFNSFVKKMDWNEDNIPCDLRAKKGYLPKGIYYVTRERTEEIILKYLLEYYESINKFLEEERNLRNLRRKYQIASEKFDLFGASSEYEERRWRRREPDPYFLFFQRLCKLNA